MKLRNSEIYNILSKLCMFAAVILCVISLSGCGVLSSIDEGLKENKRKSDDKYWTERNVPPVELNIAVSSPGEAINFDVDMRVSRCVYKYLEDGDKKQLAGMFAKSVTDSYDALDSDLEELIQFYQQLKVSEVKMDSNRMYKVNRLDPAATIVEYTYRSEFVYNNEQYRLEIMFVRDSNPDKDLLGVHGIKLRNRDTNQSVIVNTVDTDI